MNFITQDILILKSISCNLHNLTGPIKQNIVIHTIMQQKIHKRLTSMYFEKKVLLDNDVMSSLFRDPDEIRNRVSAYSHPWQKII